MGILFDSTNLYGLDFKILVREKCAKKKNIIREKERIKFPGEKDEDDDDK